MTEVEDVLDRGPRLKRGVVCLTLGLACALSVYGLMYDLVRPDTVTSVSVTANAGHAGAYKLIWYVTVLAFVVPVGVAWALLANRARKQWYRERFPEAKVRSLAREGHP